VTATWSVEVLVYSEYGQFQLADRDSDAKFDWDGIAHERHVAIGDDVLSVATTTMFGDVVVNVEVFVSEPLIDLAAADHIVEASLNFSSGRASITSISSDIPLNVELRPGWFRVRVTGRNLARGAFSDPELQGDDRYLVQLWPASAKPPVLLKAWPNWSESSAM
jgi:hypothetical protein